MLLMLALLQVTLMPHLTVAHVQPDLVASAVFCWALFGGATEGAVLGFVGGLSLDVLSGAPFGTHTFVLAVAGTIAGLGAALVPREHAILLPGVVVVCTLVQQAAYVWLLRATGWPLSLSEVLIPVIAPLAVLNLLLTALLYPLAGLLHRRTMPEGPGW